MKAKLADRGAVGLEKDLLGLARELREEIGAYARAWRKRLQTHRVRYYEHRELMRMDARQLKDIGLTQSDIPAIVDGSYFRDASRFPRRAAGRLCG